MARVFTSTEDALALTKGTRFPVIIKPNSGVGASDTYKIKSAEELEDFLAIKIPQLTISWKNSLMVISLLSMA